MVYASVCSGIEAASVAWEPLGWKPAWFSEIDPHACAVLEHRFPHVENLGDITEIDGRPYRGAIDVLVGGTPCVSFSVAGLRKGLDDDRGNLVFEFLRLAREIRPRWLVWENVPGVLSSTSHEAPDPCPPDIDLDGDDGPGDGEEVVVIDEYDSEEDHAFACFLAGLSELGYGYCFRTLNSEFIRVRSHPRAVPQRRRRVFVVGYSGDWRPPAAVFVERESLQGHPAPRRKAGKAIASLTASGVGTCGADDSQAQHGHLIAEGVAEATPPLTSNPYGDHESREGLLVPEISPVVTSKWAKGSGGPAGDECQNIVIAIQGSASEPIVSESGESPTLDTKAAQIAVVEVAGTLDRDYGKQGGTTHQAVRSGLLVGFSANERSVKGIMTKGEAPAMRGDNRLAIAQAVNGADGEIMVRRITPREAERLQGFPDDWTLVPYRGKLMADGPRYRMLGNSMAINVMSWIGQRIALLTAED